MKLFLTTLLAILLFPATVTAKPAPKTYTPVQLVEIAKRSLVKVEFQVDGTNTHTCAGFIVDAPRGWVLTALHCVGDGINKVNGEPSEIVRYSETFAILKIKPMSKPPMDISKDLPEIGEAVLGVGYGYDTLSIVYRHVSAITNGDIGTDGPFIPGMSGGPILNERGQVVGIIQAANEIIGVGCGAPEMREFINSK